MSTMEATSETTITTYVSDEPKKRRGRPPKNEEDKVVKDKKEYSKQWHETHKNDPEQVEKRKLQHYLANRRHRDLYSLIQNIMKTDEASLTNPETIQTIKRLVLVSK